MLKKRPLSLLLILLIALPVGVIHAQEEGQRRGTIQGRVYEDVNGDGQCVNTGVEGENPIEGIDVRMTSSDRETVITHYSGPEGIYGLAAAGYSNWEVTVLPPAGWVVTSEPTLYVPIYEDSLADTNVNFCLQRVDTHNARIILPQSGATTSTNLVWAAFAGLAFIMMGLGLAWRQRQIS